MSFLVNGVADADNLLMSMRPADLLSWLRQGFSLLDSDDPETRRDAFPPLELAPDRDLLSQVATSLREAERHGLKCARRVRRIVRERLKLATALSRESVPDLNNFWRLLGGINCPADIFADARRFLADLVRTQAVVPVLRSTSIRSLVDAVVACVIASKPASAVQVSFMHFVRREPALWSDRYVDAFIDCTFAELASRKIIADNRRIESWCATRDALGADLDVRADATTPTGRALIRSVARHLGLAIPGDTGVEGASELRARIFGLWCEGVFPAADFSRKQELGELLDEWA